MRPLVKAQVLLMAWLVAGCSADYYREHDGPEIRTKLERAKAIATDFRQAEPSPLQRPEQQLVLCVRASVGPKCNTIVVMPEALENPEAQRIHHMTPISGFGGVLGNAATVLKDGSVISEERGMVVDGEPTYKDRPMKQSASGVKHWFGQFRQIQYYFVVRERPARGQTGNSTYGADLFLYDANTGKAYGSAPVDVGCQVHELVNTRTGRAAGSTTCIGSQIELALADVVRGIGGSTAR
ncbi:MAG: hypothetical protein AB7K71_11835 [Polyangiaceae bacterium]